MEFPAVLRAFLTMALKVLGKFLPRLECLGVPKLLDEEEKKAHKHKLFGLVRLRIGTGEGVITEGVFSLEESLESLKSLESLEHGRILLCFPQSGGSLESLNSIESLDNRLFCKDPFSKRPFFPNPREVG